MNSPITSSDPRHVHAATWTRKEQLSLLKEMRDIGPVRVFVMSDCKKTAVGERHYDITGYFLLPWVLNKKKGWVQITDTNLCSITPAGVAALKAWEQHQFEPVDVSMRGDPVFAIPESTIADLQHIN